MGAEPATDVAWQTSDTEVSPQIAHGNPGQYVLKPGYRQTEVGVIPEDWEVKTLGDVGECLIGLTYNPSNVKEHGLLVLRSSNISNGRLVLEDNVFVDVDVPKRIRAQKGDILICVRNGSRDLIGKCALIDEQVTGETFGAFMSVFRTPHSDYVFYQFQSELVKRQIHENIGATINQITNKDLNSFKIPIPPLPEQHAIAAALSDVDALLAKLDALIIKKREVKQAAMQQLLTGKQRLPGFSGEWEVKRLGDVGTFSKGRGIRKDEVASGGLPCIRYGEIYTRHNDYIKVFHSFIPRRVANQSQRLRRGDLLFAGSGETAEEIGKCVAFLSDEETYAGGDIVIFTPSGQDSMYLGYLMNHSSISYQKARMGQGDAVVHISAANLAQLELRLPRPEEQTAIAAVLSDMDAEITALETRRDKTRALKQGMMQELLTGRIRLL